MSGLRWLSTITKAPKTVFYRTNSSRSYERGYYEADNRNYFSNKM